MKGDFNGIGGYLQTDQLKKSFDAQGARRRVHPSP